MIIQYATFSTLVLSNTKGGFPIYPFDPATGRSGNIGYHYHPCLSVVKLPGGLGYMISSSTDDDSRRLCCISGPQEDLGRHPDLLLDSVRMGLAAFGGRLLNHREALDLAQRLQPEREETKVDPDPSRMGGFLRLTYGKVSLGVNRLLDRKISIIPA